MVSILPASPSRNWRTRVNQTDIRPEYSLHADGTTEYEAGDEIEIAEEVTGLPEGCTNDPTGDLGSRVLISGRNLFTVTNTVTCTRLTLVKSVVGDADPATWTLEADGPTPLSGATGAANVTSAVVTPGSYALTESSGAAGYQQTDLSCTPNTVTDGTVVLAKGDHVTCTFVNTALVSLQVTKTWVINGTEYANGSQPVGSAELLINGATAIGFGDIVPGYLVGQNVSIGEAVDLPDLCTNVTTIDGVATDTVEHTMVLAPNPNVVSVVNTVTCEQQITLVKNVDNAAFGGTNLATDWTLTAAGSEAGSPTVSGETGDPAVWPAAVTAGGYLLSEEGPAGYQAREWSCTRTQTAGDTPETVGVQGGTVNVALGDNVLCEITNTALPGSVSWSKIAAGSGVALAGSTWSLAGPGVPDDTVVLDCFETPCTVAAFADTNATEASFTLDQLKWGDYTLTEHTAPPGYELDTTAHPFSITGASLHYEFSDAFENTQLPGPQLPLTGGLGRDHVYLAGSAVLLLAVAAYGAFSAYKRRTRRSLT